ncbi:hypothetical protein SLA2020_261450 [Shorea laevis]
MLVFKPQGHVIQSGKNVQNFLAIGSLMVLFAKLKWLDETRAAKNSESSIGCDCNNDVCHVVRIVLKSYSLPGILPPQLVKLPYLREIDFAYNYLNGTIPLEWTSMQLTSIFVLANRVSGEIPKELGNITSLTYLYVLNFGLKSS